MKKRLLLLLPAALILPRALCAAAISADAPWRLLESARIAFEDGEFGAALEAAERAKEQKKLDYGRYEKILTDAVKSAEVRAAGDEIPAARAALEARNEYDALAVIARFTALKSAAYFGNKVSEIAAYLKRMAVFPEAERLIGSVYRMEGELALARRYYTRAWEQAFALDIPDEKYGILYDLAALAGLQEDDELYEQSLLLALADDSYFNDSGAGGGQSDAEGFYASVQRNLERGYPLDRIFEMYRVNGTRSLPAYIGLAGFYRGRNMDAEFLKTSVLGCLAAFTRMYETVKARDIAYEYRGAADFFTAASRYRDITAWAEKEGVWQCFEYARQAAQRRSLDVFAGDLARLLAACP